VKKKAADGLPARTGGIWTREKLTYLEKYASAFMKAMGPKRSQGLWKQLVYIDLLAGPGRDIDPETEKEFDGSPLIALAVKPRFDHLYLADKARGNVTALEARISAEDKDRVTVMLGDCNVLVDEVLKRIPSGSLGLAFVDPQGFEVNFDTLAKFAKRRIGLLYLFPSGIGVRRNLRNFMALSESRMDKWWGSKDWRQLPAAKQAAGEISTSDSQKIIGSLVPEYRQLLAAVGFKYQDEAVALFTNTKNAQMYHLLFCSHSKAGLDIWKGIKRIAPSGQRGLWKE